jgi:PhnB protein
MLFVMTDPPSAAHGKYTQHGTPHGYTSLSPHLVATPAEDAIAFYQQVFAAKLLDVIKQGNTVLHAVLELANGRFTLSDPMQSYGLVAPTGEAASITLALYVPNVDQVVERAIAAGARVREALTTFVSGDRYASLLDPFGVRWAVMTRVEDLSPEESAKRVADWAKAQG